ncbi:DUF4910 domain-containing protein [Candidatus Pelagibacter sp. HIMB1483]|uniref:DUF4910 domain-containing protein n=1 Tax=Candidatus Pelagibacter sp. HIMB1483 TaxID=3415414 RepID=UPI003F863F09
MIGNKVFNLAKKVWNYNRSLTGQGVRDTLNEFKKINKDLKINKVRSGTKAFDWEIPLEWNVREAYISDPSGKKICDFHKNNLHLVGYSIPQKKSFNLEQIKKKIYTYKKIPKAIPYHTSYYKKDWGFCMSLNQKKKLKKGIYKVNINTSLKKGYMNFGEIFIKGKKKKEIFFSTYVCHPSMANNELSGPCTMIYFSDYLKKIKLNYSVRILFIPESIGSIYYLSKNYKKMKKNIISGFNISCIGDNRSYSFISSRKNNTDTDKITRYVYKNISNKFKEYSWNDRGSDEKNYCAPGIDLPVCTIMRSKFGKYKEYHTSEDKLGKVVSKVGLNNSFELLKKIHYLADNYSSPKTSVLGEPFLTKYNLYPTLSSQNLPKKTMLIKNIITYSDGDNSIIDIAEKCKVSVWDIIPLIKMLQKKKILKNAEQ